MGILVTEIKQIQNKKYIVKFDNAESIPLYMKDINNFNIIEGKEISSNTYNSICNELLNKRARERVLHILDRAGKTEQELRVSLSRSGYEQTIIDTVMNYVKDYGFVNDAYYTKNYIEINIDKKSKKQMYEFLFRKGINKEIIDNVFLDFEIDESTLILQYINKKTRNTEELDNKSKNRLYLQLAGRGFSSEQILKAFRDMNI